MKDDRKTEWGEAVNSNQGLTGLTPELRDRLTSAEASGASDAQLLLMAMQACGDDPATPSQSDAVQAWLGWSDARFIAACEAVNGRDVSVALAVMYAYQTMLDKHPDDWPSVVATYAAKGVPDDIMASAVVSAAAGQGMLVLVPTSIAWKASDIQRWTGWPQERAKAAFDGSCLLWLEEPFYSTTVM
jgi:hypothetical protein